ncbi:MAG: hypothetical protein LUE14_04005 [Clostridiales bacterium]|nr:hypothetical protein [Clostridiales bacterium]
MRYIVTKQNIGFAEEVLSRDRVYFEKEGGMFTIQCDPEYLEILEEDVQCEKQRASTRHHTPVYSLRTLRDPEKKQRLMAYNGRTDYQVLQKDKTEYEQFFS